MHVAYNTGKSHTQILYYTHTVFTGIYRVGQKKWTPNALHITSSNIGDFKNSFTVIISRKFAMQRSLTISPHLKRVAALPCEMFMSENSLLISEIHLIISLHFSFIEKQRTETSKMIVRYVKVIFFCFNIKYSMVFIEYMLRWISHSLYAPHRTEHASFLT